MRSLADASAFHLADCRYRNLSPDTLRAYASYQRVYLAWLDEHGGGGTGLRALNAAGVRACAEWMQGRHGGKRGGTHAKRQFVAALKVWSGFLTEEGLLEADPLARLRRPQVEEGARSPYEAWEIQALRGAMHGTHTGVRDTAMLALMLDTGVRIAELCGLLLAHLDLPNGRVRVQGKGRRERIIPFGTNDRGGGRTTKLLRDYLAARRPADPRTPQLFLSYDGHPLQPAGFRGAFKRAALAGGVTDPEPHRCRHTFAVRWLIAHPGEVDGLRYLMGHLSPTQYQLYTRQAGQILAELAGRDSLFEVMSDERPTSRRGNPRLRRVQ